ESSLYGRSVSAFVPKGRPNVAQHLQCWELGPGHDASPVGTAELLFAAGSRGAFSRPYGTREWLLLDPPINRWATFTPSLRDEKSPNTCRVGCSRTPQRWPAVARKRRCPGGRSGRRFGRSPWPGAGRALPGGERRQQFAITEDVHGGGVGEALLGAAPGYVQP